MKSIKINAFEQEICLCHNPSYKHPEHMYSYEAHKVINCTINNMLNVSLYGE